MKKGYSPMMYVHIIITLFLMFGFGFLPPFATLTPMGMRLLGTFLGVIYGYSTCEIIWPSLFAFIAYGLSGFPGSMNAGISATMGSSTVFQIITQYFTAGAIVIYGFGKWFIRWSLSQKAFKGKPLFYTWCFMFIFMWSCLLYTSTFPESSFCLKSTASSMVLILNTPGSVIPGTGGMTADAPVLINISS